MTVYLDRRNSVIPMWRYRKRLTMPNGTRKRIEGTPATNTKKAAEHAEALHILRVMNPELVPPKEAPKAKESKVPTLAEFAQTFLDHYGTDHKPGPQAQKRVIVENQLVPFFGGMRIDEIRQMEVDQFVAEQLKRVGRKTVNNRLAVLSKLIRYAADNIKGLVLYKLRCHVKAPKAEVHAVPAADVAKLLAAAKDHRYVLAILLASEAGLRVGEIRGLQWGDIKDGRVTIRRSIDPRGNVGPPKNGKARAVKVSVSLQKALDASPRKGLWVVPNESGDVIGYWVLLGKKARVKKGRGQMPAEGLHAVYAAAGLVGPDMPFHCLRHTFGTELAKKVPLPVVKKLMGHSDVATTMRYVDVVEDQEADAIDLVFSGRYAGDSSSNRA